VSHSSLVSDADHSMGDASAVLSRKLDATECRRQWDDWTTPLRPSGSHMQKDAVELRNDSRPTSSGVGAPLAQVTGLPKKYPGPGEGLVHPRRAPSRSGPLSFGPAEAVLGRRATCPRGTVITGEQRFPRGAPLRGARERSTLSFRRAIGLLNVRGDAPRGAPRRAYPRTFCPTGLGILEVRDPAATGHHVMTRHINDRNDEQ